MALPVGLLMAPRPFYLCFYKRNKRLNLFQKGLPEALDLMVSALRAGHSLVAAIGSVARECADPIGCEFRACFDEQNYGLELKTALDNLINRVPLQDLRIFATAIIIQKESGETLPRFWTRPRTSSGSAFASSGRLGSTQPRGA